MIRVHNYALSHPRWLVVGLCAFFPLIPLAIWLLGIAHGKTVATWIFVGIWFLHFILGVGAGYAALRLWYSRNHPLIARVGLYINAFIIDVLSAVVLLFMARGVTLTWKFTTVMFVSTLLSDIVRAPLIIYLIRGTGEAPHETLPVQVIVPLSPDEWMERVRVVVRQEVAILNRERTDANDTQ